jgi:hypothetical protein
MKEFVSFTPRDAGKSLRADVLSSDPKAGDWSVCLVLLRNNRVEVGVLNELISQESRTVPPKRKKRGSFFRV